ncbi:MAG: hypothetical protein IPJ65_21545 [Archangiaceae bacterium]|nr:hypothetical protein [Archangiaceae bacterium]
MKARAILVALSLLACGRGEEPSTYSSGSTAGAMGTPGSSGGTTTPTPTDPNPSPNTMNNSSVCGDGGICGAGVCCGGACCAFGQSCCNDRCFTPTVMR